MTISINEWLEDFDNSELSNYENEEQLRDAVIQYNEDNGTNYDPVKTVKKYKQSQRAIQY